jgi:hypothetical protein
MSFDYRKNKHGNDSDSFWTSYSDLFLGLSTIFLLLYVTASLRTGTDAIKAQVDNRKLSMENEELKSQLKMYEAVKSNYMEKDASKNEVNEYNELMDKLTLLEEESKDERDKLAKQALENDRKSVALNKYQQLVRNIINANKLQKTKVMARNDLIEEQDTTIDQQKKDINSLETEVEQKKQQIADNQTKIERARAALAKKKKDLLAAYKAQEMTKAAYDEKVRQTQEAGVQKIEALKAVNKDFSNQLNRLSSELKGTQVALKQKSKESEQLSSKLDRVANEAEGLKSKMAGLRAAHNKELAAANASLEAEFQKGQMDAAERARREGQLRADAARKEQELNGKLAGLAGALKETEGKLVSTQGALAKAKEEADLRRGIAREIQRGFKAAGVKADIDMQTGEVLLDFGENYFESDSANLKDAMKDIIERAMPVYSRSLFGNPKLADKITTVEVVGFASPTYKGRFVDPNSNKADDKAALKYNMDLSYRRANSIFNYLLENNSQFDHQKDLLSLMKVSGRSFLEVMKVKGGRNPANAAEFCKKNDCKKAQRVVVRFSMDGKK